MITIKLGAVGEPMRELEFVPLENPVPIQVPAETPEVEEEETVPA